MDMPEHSTMPVESQIQSMTPYVQILEQPAPKHLRFRYVCEGRSAGSITGVNHSSENPTFPTIKVLNYQGRFAVVVSLVTREHPYRPHPHNLVGRDGCKHGVCTVAVEDPEMICRFKNLGIQCVKKRDIVQSLQSRADHNIDPFGTGFSHQSQPGSIDLNIVRLCFQVFLRGPDGRFTHPLAPVVSDPIYDKKAISDLTIMKLSHYSAPVCGGTEVILLCDRVAKEDIQVFFYETIGNDVTWEGQAEFQPSDVHKQFAIAFRTPRYYNENVQQPVSVFVLLKRPSDNATGEPRPFQFLPMERDPEGLARKRLKIEEKRSYLQRHVMSGAQCSHEHQPIPVPRVMRHPTRQPLQLEGPTPQGAIGGEPYNFQQYTIHPSTITISIPIQAESLTSQAHLAPAHSPSLAMSPGAHSYSSSVPSPISLATMMTSGHPQTISPVMSPLQDFVDQNSPQHIQQAAAMATGIVDDIVIEKFDSLGLDIDSNELIPGLNLNLSTSMFDSANNLMESPLQEAIRSTQEQQNLNQADDFNRNYRIQNEL